MDEWRKGGRTKVKDAFSFVWFDGLRRGER